MPAIQGQALSACHSGTSAECLPFRPGISTLLIEQLEDQAGEPLHLEEVVEASGELQWGEGGHLRTKEVSTGAEGEGRKGDFMNATRRTREGERTGRESLLYE